MHINCQDANSLIKEMNLNPIMQSAGGFIAKMTDQEYMSINAHSKHRIEPALKTGEDYEYSEDNKTTDKEASDAIKDGSLLHCLTLERAEFEDRYMVAIDFDEMHKDNPLYFATQDELKQFITKHNQTHKGLVAESTRLITSFNKELKDELIEDIEFDQLPDSKKTGEVSKRSIKKCIEQFKSKYLVLIDLSTPDDARIDEQAEALYSAISGSLTNWLNDSFSKKWNKAERARDKARLLNQLINEQGIKFEQLDDEQCLAQIPTDIKVEFYTATSKKAAVKAFLAEKKSDCFQIDLKQSLEKQVADLKLNGVVLESRNESQYFTKIPTLGSKHETQGEWELPTLLTFITKIYASPAMYKRHLIEEQKASAKTAQKILISSERLAHAERIVEAVFKHKDAKKWLTLPNNVFEYALVWNDEKTGNLCKGKADVLNLEYNVMVDIKFVRTVDFNKLDRDSSSMNYHIQDAMYRTGFNKIVGATAKNGEVSKLNKFVFIAVEKDAAKLGAEQNKPCRVRVVEYIKKDDITRASRLIDGAIFRINKWSEMERYEGYEGMSGIEVPAYQRKQENELLDLIEQEMQEYEAAKADAQPLLVPDDKPSTHKGTTMSETHHIQENDTDSEGSEVEQMVPPLKTRPTLPESGALFL